MALQKPSTLWRAYRLSNTHLSTLSYSSMVSLVSCIVVSHSLTFSNSDLSISLNMNFIFLQWIQIYNRILCRLIQFQSGYRLSNVERFILIQRKSLLISFIHKKIIYFRFLVQEQYPVLEVLLPYKITLLSNLKFKIITLLISAF